MKLLLAALILALATLAGHAQTAWPDYIHALQPDVPDSPVAATLPADVRIAPPAPDLAAARARWSGRWQGWACAGQVCDIRIAVERVDAQGATLAYAGASTSGSTVQRGEARFEGEELHMVMDTGSRLVLRLRAGGDMEMSLWREGRVRAAGVLTQKPLEAAWVRADERLATPWTHDGQPVTLAMVVYRPKAGTGPWPTVVVNHGSTGNGDRPDLFPHVFTSLDLVRHFTQQGWQVLFPQRRGRGGSGGLYDEGFPPDRARYSCDPRWALAGFDRAMEDLHLVMQHVAARPDVDARRVLLAGVSRGGILAAVYAGVRPGQVAGVVNFVGGWMGDRCPQVEQINPVLFRRAAAFPKPALWLYGSGDTFYALGHSRANFEAFRAAGGQGRFVAYELPAGQNGHYIAGRRELWQADVDAYLQSLPAP